jgi:hypothetical protein
VFGPAPSEARATPVTNSSKPLNITPQKTKRAGA